MSWLSNWFSSLFSASPKKDCIQKALECADELRKRMPDADIVTVTGPMLEADNHNQMRWENCKLQEHRMAAINVGGEWQFYELQQGIPVRVPALEHWEPTRSI